MDDNDFFKDMKDILQPDIGTETGNDDYVYGNYIEWPTLEKLNNDQIKELIDYFGLGETVYGMFKKCNVPDYESLEKEEFNDFKKILNPEIEVDNDYMFDTYIEWPSLDELTNDQFVELIDYLDLKEEIYDKLEKCGVPQGTDYENGNPDFPESERYFREEKDLDQEYSYQDYVSTMDSFKDDYNDLKDRIDNFVFNSNTRKMKDEITLYYLNLEDLFKRKVSQILPNPDEFDLPESLQKVIRNTYTDQLRNINNQKFKSFIQSFIGNYRKIGHHELRNALAHNRSKVTFENQNINYPEKGKLKSVKYVEIINEMKDYLNWVDKLGSDN